MLDRLRELTNRIGGGDPEEDNQPAAEFKALRLLTAHLLLLTSVEVALDSLGRTKAEDPGPPYPHGSPGPERSALAMTLRWAPTLLAPIAAAAHVQHALRPTAPSARTVRVMNAAAIGGGVAGLVGSFLASRRTGKAPSLTPLALASTGVLGLILEREERDASEARRRLERKASIVDRLLPRPGRRIERIVVHV
jgi:hypothetical protein